MTSKKILDKIEAKSQHYRKTKKRVHTHSFEEIATKVEKLVPNTKNALKLSLAVATSGTRNNDTMLWLMLVGSPSSGKTEIVSLIRNNKSVVNRDVITTNAFASGERSSKKNKVYDLLPVLDNKCFILKDWTVVFSLDEKATKKIVGDMVAIYDKVFSKHSSQRGEVTYASEFSHLGCITPATLNRHNQYLNMIGARFLHYSIPDLTEEQLESSFASIFDSTRDRKEELKKVRKEVSTYLDQLNKKKMNIKPFNDNVINFLKTASRFVSKARGVVIIASASFKNETGETITYYEPLETQIEQPFRAVQQLITLLKYVVFVSGRDEVQEDDLELVKDVVMSTMPADRALAMNVLINTKNQELTAKDLKDTLNKSIKTSRRLLDELVFLGLVEKKREAFGAMAATYTIHPDFKDFCVRAPISLSPYSEELEAKEDIVEVAKELFQ